MKNPAARCGRVGNADQFANGLELQNPSRTVGALDDGVYFRRVQGAQVFGVPFDLLPLGPGALAGPDGEVPEQDRLGEGAGVIREVRDDLWASLDRRDPFLEMAWRFHNLDRRRFCATGQIKLVTVVAMRVQRILLSDDQCTAAGKILVGGVLLAEQFPLGLFAPVVPGDGNRRARTRRWKSELDDRPVGVTVAVMAGMFGLDRGRVLQVEGHEG